MVSLDWWLRGIVSLYQKVLNKRIDDNYVGYLIQDVLDSLGYFQFVSFSFIKREGNRLAHDLAHWRLIDHRERILVDDLPRSITDKVSEEMYSYIESILI